MAACRRFSVLCLMICVIPGPVSINGSDENQHLKGKNESLQAEITERGRADIPEWKLDEEKKTYEKMMLNTENLFETIVRKSKLEEQKRKLEEDKTELKGKVIEVESQKEENKKKLQLVETKITERGRSDIPEELLREKEKLLEAEWKLDEEKKTYEKMMLNTEKLLETIESLSTNAESAEKDDAVMGAASSQDCALHETTAYVSIVCSIVATVIVLSIIGVYQCFKKKNASLQKQIDKTEGELKDSPRLRKLGEQKRKLEEEKRMLGGKVNEVESKREENKKKLQSVETEITEREKLFDNTKESVREKEKLLEARWKLDEEKKSYEEMMLHIEKLLQITETLLTDDK